jgi:hypothetical protein
MRRLNIYKCRQCGGEYIRRSQKEYIRTYCRKSGKKVNLTLLNI